MKNKFRVFDKLRVFVKTALERSNKHIDEDPLMDKEHISDKTPLWIISLIILGFFIGITVGYEISGKASITLET